MKNYDIFEESKKYMPGGVNSPVRAFKDVDLNPPVIKKGEGAYVYDEDNNKYIDFVCSWGPMILGHCDGDVVNAIKNMSEKAISFGATTKIELELAKYICTTVDNIDMIRMVNSGTEATMSAVKLARGYTGKSKIIKFAGGYHGHFDGFLVEAGSGVMTEGIPGSAGVPEESVKNTIIAQYNDIESVQSIFEKYKSDIAAIIVEPVAGNMGVIPGDREFLGGLRSICDKYKSLLIFDEVMSGFRVAYKGAQSLYGIKPDITTFAKIMGGGLPCGAYGGRRDIMEKLSPMGPVYQAGTMSGNPVVMAAGFATLKKLHENPEYYIHLDKLGNKLQSGVEEIAKNKNIPVVFNRCGAMLTIFFTKNSKIKNYEDAKKCNIDIFNRYFKHMIKNGIYIAPSQFEAVFLNVKHTEEDIDKFLEAFDSFEI
ncbi:glutamate-1-semialdehyde 2,1-aminomutase [Clostridium tyrobutyricum]|uniref:glutamate-1-semialdehyde 2,1-aminomutase n=1 Tax=Clostridium tyrobutyricum TaxID=1519 RepID=UPI001C387EB0|nr:glutamate-1-semialdehyde 2,1-aminomutase [Clostridium tyrobutyricum]MBV4417924.1 glutamate-1-semialdehyde 2,1-aminomutase [Clostridium tyrobutyricum]